MDRRRRVTRNNETVVMAVARGARLSIRPCTRPRCDKQAGQCRVQKGSKFRVCLCQKTKTKPASSQAGKSGAEAEISSAKNTPLSPIVGHPILLLKSAYRYLLSTFLLFSWHPPVVQVQIQQRRPLPSIHHLERFSLYAVSRHGQIRPRVYLFLLDQQSPTRCSLPNSSLTSPSRTSRMPLSVASSSWWVSTSTSGGRR